MMMLKINIWYDQVLVDKIHLKKNLFFGSASAHVNFIFNFKSE